jgi:hypothetical protein
MLRLLPLMVFFWEIHVFLQLIWRGLFRATWAFSTVKTMICRKRSFQKLTQFLHGNNVLGAAACNIDGFLFWEIHLFLQLSWIGLFGTKWAFSTLKTLTCRKHSFLKRTQLSQRNNVLEAAASNIGGFLCRDTRVSSSQVNRPIWNVDSLSQCS